MNKYMERFGEKAIQTVSTTATAYIVGKTILNMFKAHRQEKLKQENTAQEHTSREHAEKLVARVNADMAYKSALESGSPVDEFNALVLGNKADAMHQTHLQAMKVLEAVAARKNISMKPRVYNLNPEDYKEVSWQDAHTLDIYENITEAIGSRCGTEIYRPETTAQFKWANTQAGGTMNDLHEAHANSYGVISVDWNHPIASVVFDLAQAIGAVEIEPAIELEAASPYYI